MEADLEKEKRRLERQIRKKQESLQTSSFFGDKLPPPFNGRYEVRKKIGAGAFGEIYFGLDTRTKLPIAVKVEPGTGRKQVLKIEVSVLRKLQSKPTHFPHFLYCGKSNNVNYLVMELCGENLSELRRRQPNQRFSIAQLSIIGKQMLTGIRDLHEVGYLHRDIKPSNFILGRKDTEKEATVLLIDFGLARRYRMGTGDVRPERKYAGFRGTARYASMKSHLGRDLSRVDDLISWWYLMIEFGMGSLPWRKLKDKDEIGKMKEVMTNNDLVKDLPVEFSEILEHLHSLNYADTPDYDLLFSKLDKMITDEGEDPETIEINISKVIDVETVSLQLDSAEIGGGGSLSGGDGVEDENVGQSSMPTMPSDTGNFNNEDEEKRRADEKAQRKAEKKRLREEKAAERERLRQEKIANATVVTAADGEILDEKTLGERFSSFIFGKCCGNIK